MFDCSFTFFVSCVCSTSPWVVRGYAAWRARSPKGLDTKRKSSSKGRILTFAELEAATCLGLTGLFTFNGTGVAGHEAFLAESLLVVGIDFNKCAGDSEAESLALSGVATSEKVHLDVVLLSHIEEVEGLLNDILQNG